MFSLSTLPSVVSGSVTPVSPLSSTSTRVTVLTPA